MAEAASKKTRRKIRGENKGDVNDAFSGAVCGTRTRLSPIGEQRKRQNNYSAAERRR